MNEPKAHEESAPTKIRIMIVEDHEIFRTGLRRLLEMESDLEVIGEAANGEEAITLADELYPDVILMDINLPHMNGLMATRQIKNKHPDTNVVVLTAFHDDAQLLHALRAGASAYYPKEVTPATLINCIREVKDGSYVVGDVVMDWPQVAAWLLEQFEEMTYIGDSPEDIELGRPLSEREMEILRCIVRGLSNKEIAKQLDISQQTVKNHMTAILRKLGVSDRTQAAMHAMKKGLIHRQDA